jgi:tol-pal system protein YbgF
VNPGSPQRRLLSGGVSGWARLRRPRLGWWLLLAGAFALSACALPEDNQQQSNDQDLRNTVASDRQQINALQDEVNRLNDHIAEMEHNGDAGGASADSQKLAELEREVQQLKSGGAATPPGGMPPASGPGAPADVNGVPGGSPNGPADASGAPPGAGAPGVNGVPPPGAPGAMSPPPPANATNGPPNSAANDDNDESDDDADNRSEVASNAPPPAASPPAAPGPPMVNGAPSWRAMLNQELAASQSSSDPAAKAYRAGLIAMKAGKYPNAIGGFQGLQRKYPKSSLSEPAEYFSANALFELGKYDQAILQFNDLVMRFPRGRFASASLLSEAQAFTKMNDPIDARLTLQKLISDHPDAPEAATARAMMNSLASG